MRTNCLAFGWFICPQNGIAAPKSYEYPVPIYYRRGGRGPIHLDVFCRQLVGGEKRELREQVASKITITGEHRNQDQLCLIEIVNTIIMNDVVQNYLQISRSLSVLRWYISGLSELPLGNPLILLLAGAFPAVLCFLHFSWRFRFFFSFLLPFRVRACTSSTAPRASPAPSRVPAGTGG